MEKADQEIFREVKANSQLMKNIEFLTTRIGPRLTGSPQMQAASDWSLKRFHDYGLDAHLETTTIPRSWQRGTESAEILSPISRAISVRSIGWGMPTPSTLTGRVLLLRLRGVRDLEKYAGKLRGVIVLPFEPSAIHGSDESPDNAHSDLSPAAGRNGSQELSVEERVQLLRVLTQRIAQEGAAAILLDSSKVNGLLNTTDTYIAGKNVGYDQPDLPIAFITHEDYALLSRLSSSEAVTMKLHLESVSSSKPVPTSITVAEIKGSDLPEQRVILGAHLDSWDLGQGALDNGTGAVAVMEAARALKSLGWIPKRTITFILFSGEEEGGTGAKLFISDHAAEIPQVDAALVLDSGTGRVISITLEELWETGSLMSKIYQPLAETFALRPLETEYLGQSDHIFFLRQGVPAYYCVQSPAHYAEAHHSQSDTFDLVLPDEINQSAAFLAAWAWNVSEMPSQLPHHAPEPSATK
jgi:hypothetical protein